MFIKDVFDCGSWAGCVILEWRVTGRFEAGLRWLICIDRASSSKMSGLNSNTSRRDFLRSAGIGAAAAMAGTSFTKAGASEEFVIDTHTHFYDPGRPQGVPWPPKDDAVLYRTVLPQDYLGLPTPTRVHGTVVVEASPWIEDNQWVLDLAAHEHFIVGLVGNLPVETKEFPRLLRRFRSNRLFRGIRLHGSSLGKNLAGREYVEHLAQLENAGLALDVVGPPEMLEHVAGLARALPRLRIVIDHVGGVRVDGNAPPSDWRRGMEEVAHHRRVYCKVSGLVEGTGRTGGKAPVDVEFYRPVLDVLWDAFGEDRLIYGSNWPVCEHFATLATVQGIVSAYFGRKSARASAKVFSRNAIAAYGVVRRNAAQHRGRTT